MEINDYPMLSRSRLFSSVAASTQTLQSVLRGAAVTKCVVMIVVMQNKSSRLV